MSYSTYIWFVEYSPLMLLYEHCKCSYSKTWRNQEEINFIVKWFEKIIYLKYFFLKRSYSTYIWFSNAHPLWVTGILILNIKIKEPRGMLVPLMLLYEHCKCSYSKTGILILNIKIKEPRGNLFYCKMIRIIKYLIRRILTPYVTIWTL